MSGDSSPLSDAPDVCAMTAGQLTAAYARGDLSPVEAAVAAMDRAEAINPLYNAFTNVDREGGMTAARASEARWRAGAPLSAVDGIPTTLKDIVWVKDRPVRYGSATTPDAPMQADAPAVERLRKAGCVFIGQTTTPEFGWKAVTDSPAYGITRNPWSPEKTPGGSSGGAAVAAATGAGVFHLGTDGGGSIRIPAAFTGIAGLKPSFGRIPAYPPSVFGTVAHLGPMARTVDDLRMMLAEMSGHDPRDWHQGAAVLPPLTPPPVAISTLRIGYWSRPPSGQVDPEVAELVAVALRRIAGEGAEVAPVELPQEEDLHGLFHLHWFTGAAARLAKVPEALRAGLDPGFLAIARAGAEVTGAALVAAQARRAAFGVGMDRLLAGLDVIVSPAVAIPAFGAGCEVPEGSGMTRWTEWAGFSYPVNLSQQPACTIPCGTDASGLPVGLQIVGARGEDARVLAIAAMLEPFVKSPPG